ncbi:MAG: hypothetical protein ABIP94_23715 [Planctomycetota bacterium]
MMSFLASFALLAVVFPQGTPAGQQGGTASPPAEKALLSASERASLRDKFVKYIDADENYVRATGLRDREKAGRTLEKAKEAFDTEWDKYGKKGNLLGAMADLRAIFDNCFLHKRPSFSFGQLRRETVKEEGTEFSFFLPKSYNPDKPTRTIVVVPGTTAPGVTAWTKSSDYFAAVWEKSAASGDSIFQVCSPPGELELDPVPDFSRESAESEEDKRNRVIFTGLAHLMGNFNVDRPRVFLDFGRGSCGFGLRFLTMFPDRFAGVILREPVAVDDIRLGTLHGMSVLMLKTTATAKVVDALEKQLTEVSPGTIKVIDATDEYPHKGSTEAIEAWMAEQKRNMTPTKIVIEPNHDRFNRAYWASIDTATPLLTASPDAKPRLEVEANRNDNRIVVKAQGIESFVLFLNDDLVDLDKDFTVVVNDKAVVEKKIRTFRQLYDGMIVRRDWDYLFPVMYRSTVPKPAAQNGDKPEKQ